MKGTCSGNWPLDGCNSFDSNGAFSIAIEGLPIVCLSLCPPALGWPKISPANNNALLIHRTMYLYKVCVYICVYNDIDVERRPDCIRTVKYVSINKKAINFGFVNNNSVSFFPLSTALKSISTFHVGGIQLFKFNLYPKKKVQPTNEVIMGDFCQRRYKFVWIIRFLEKVRLLLFSSS